MKKALKAALLSITALAVGYLAISLPFNLFGTLTDSMMEVLFIAELAIYLTIGAIFLVVSQKKKEAREKADRRHTERRAKIARVQTDWYDLAA